MRFLIDNALSPLVAVGVQAAADSAIFDLAVQEERVLVSADTDFGTLLSLRQTTQPSVILFRRSGNRRPAQQVALLLANLPAIAEDITTGSIVIFTQDRIRVRRLPI